MKTAATQDASGWISIARIRISFTRWCSTKKAASTGIEDKGETWKKMRDTNPRPSYYSQVRWIPITICGFGCWAHRCIIEDGGRLLDAARKSIHGDFHAMWIDPKDSNHIIQVRDGGIHWSYDDGRAGLINTIAIGQF